MSDFDEGRWGYYVVKTKWKNLDDRELFQCASTRSSRIHRPPNRCTRQKSPPIRGYDSGSSSHPSQVSTMASSQQPKGRDGVLSALDVFIEALNLAKDTFGAASILLTMIRVCFPLLCRTELLIHAYQDYVELGRDCAGVCQALYRRLKGKNLDHLNQSVLEAIGGLTS